MTKTKDTNELIMFFCFYILTLGFAFPAHSIELLAPRIIGLVEKSGLGKYQLVLREAAKRSNINFTEYYYPQKRALKLFLSGRATCIYGYSDLASKVLGKDNIIVSFPIGVFKQYIFTKKGTPVLTSYEHLKDKSVGGVLGDDLQPWFSSFTSAGIHLNLVTSTEQNLRMLEEDRIDAMISFLPDIAKHIDQLNFSSEHPLLTSYDRITCYNTLEGKKVINEISPILKKMKQDGTMKQILGSFYLAYDENKVAAW